MSRVGDAPADVLIARHYDALRRLARSRLRRDAAGDTLETCGLLSEAYLRVAGVADLSANEHTRFFALMSTAMRRVLVDRARRRRRLKRGGGEEPFSLDDQAAPWLNDAEMEQLLALDEALTRLAECNPRGSAVVEHRFFGGLTELETATVLGVSAKTVQRDWRAALAWLRKEVARELADGG